MSSLTDISISVRKIAIWVGILCVSYIVLKIIADLGIAYWRAAHPPKLTPPDTQFGILPPPSFPKNLPTSAGMSFTLETISGRIPESTASAQVFPIPQKMPTFAATERMKRFALKLNFPSDTTSGNDTIYAFMDPNNSLRTLTINSVTMNYLYNFDYTKNPDVFKVVRFTTKETALKDAKSQLGNQGLFDETLLKGKTTVQMLTYNTRTLHFDTADSLATASAIRINFVRGDINGYPVVPPGYDESFTYVLYAPNTKGYESLLTIAYTYWPVALDNPGTYPLRTTQTAYDELVAGHAVIVKGYKSGGSIKIRSVKLGYYDSEEYQR
jgi:hypothetical protein